LGVTQAIKYEGQNFNVEVNRQNKMLEDVDEHMDKTKVKMMKIDGRMKNFIAKSNQCYMWSVIVLELILLTLVVIVL